MGRSSRDKIEYVKTLIEKDLQYDEIQKKLFEKFGSGMSNTTIKNLSRKKEDVGQLKTKIKDLERDLSLFKRLYFDLLEKTEKKKKSDS